MDTPTPPDLCCADSPPTPAQSAHPDRSADQGSPSHPEALVIASLCVILRQIAIPPIPKLWSSHRFFCAAGGASEEFGFFADITADSIRGCMDKNFFSSAFITYAVMKW
ncbi:hypothetical protein P168DRAFT_316087 [Aspergillus campestris IBT 28561]|uniref:Uncharacterized protein n=1 Tax=Aspergillus campestris (strain IBT 28561) TaxID=1392248 RepID=A0A2I1DCJ1_ASPC2|nr:uncharacterized protein P168DRAFT_316087 [Aspergillus campestris IBT 28561]PKY07597.1 hypothetical protein P168DRAFT_316087 [Aspergillus campestris IBT 28561]